MRVENSDARQYYMTEAADHNWSTRQLERNINTHYYERLLSTRDKKIGKDQPESPKATLKDLIKDPYVHSLDIKIRAHSLIIPLALALLLLQVP